MAIGVAMLGFGASGVAVAVRRPLASQGAAQALTWAAAASGLSLIAAPALATRIPIDATQLLWDASQWPALALLYVILAAPFAAGGLVVLLALSAERDHPGMLYGASFVGSGAGAAIALAILWISTPTRALAAPALIASFGAVAVARTLRRQRAFAWLTLAVSATILARPVWTVGVAPYKSLPQVESFPGAHRVTERSSPLGWVVAVDAPAFRYAPGLSLGYRGRVPSQLAIFVDGNLIGAVASWGGNAPSDSLLDWLPAAMPYALEDRRTVLVLGAGGNLDVATARFHGATDVTAVELLPDVVDLSLGGFPDDSRGRQPSWVIADARTFAARTSKRFDLVSLGPAGGLGGSAAGVHALNEDFLHTTEAYAQYLRLLTDEGVLAVTRWLSIPPRENVRVILTGVEALRRVAPQHVHDGLVVGRSWGTVTTLIKPSGFAAEDLARVTAWSRDRQFDIDWEPGLDTPRSEFHELIAPTLFDAASAATAGPAQAQAFTARYPFRVEPASDATPYPHHFLGLRSLATLARQAPGSWLPFTELGYLSLLATLAQSGLLAAALLLVPVLFRSRSRGPAKLAPVLGYFGAIGFAYLAAEIGLIQLLTLLLGHPVYAFTTVLTILLVCSGVGSVWSDRVRPARGWLAPLLLAAAMMALGMVLLPLVHAGQHTAFLVRLCLTVVALAPVAVLMGVPFPVGLRSLSPNDGRSVAWAWAANGFASVVAAPMAALIALEASSAFVLVGAGVAYGAAAALHRMISNTTSSK
jgi:hypothetical protein